MKKLILLLFIPLVFACSDDSSPCPNQPQITTLEVSDIGYDAPTDLASATFTGEIQNIQLGADCETFSITNQGFVYGTNIQPTTSDNVVNANGENASANVSDLTPETTYYVRAYLTNILGTFYGNEVSFTTPESINPLYLAENGITIKARDWANIGDSGIIGGVEYLIVSESDLRDKIVAEDDLFVCTSRIVNMQQMFLNSEFNQDISNWDVSNVTNMESMFNESSFNQDISNWDVSNVTNMESMFNESSFNQDIGNWDVSSVTDMKYMFSNAIFNQPIGNWDVSNVTGMEYMFYNNSTFNQPIGNWDVSNVTNMLAMFYESVFDQEIGSWDVSNVVVMQAMLGGSEFNQDISNWDVSSVTNMRAVFWNNPVFNQDIGNWDVSSVTDMGIMFANSSFNQDISNWDVSSVTIMEQMFHLAESFNQNLGNWDVDSVTHCIYFCYETPNWTLPKPNFTNCSEDLGCD